MYKMIIHMLFCLLASQFVQGQNIPSTGDYSHRVIVSTGIDPSWNLSLNYQRNVNLHSRMLIAYGEWEASVVRPGFRNWDTNLGAVIPLLKKGNFNLLTDPYLSFGRLETRNFNSLSVLLGNEVSAGFFNEKKYVAFLFAYNKILATHLAHSAYYRDTFFEDSRDAWYSSTGGYFQFGISWGFTFGSRHDLFMEIKIPVNESFGGFGGSPAHINLGYGYRI